MRVSFDFDPVTKTVTNVEVDGEVKPKATRKTSTSKQSSKIVLNGSSLKLNQEVLDLLNVKVGERLCVMFTTTQPTLVTPEAAHQQGEGNLITKSLTVSCKGKTSEQLAKYGTEWSYELDGSGHLLLSNETTTVIDTTEVKEMQQTLLDDSDFLSAVENGEEIDFSFEINK